MRNGVLSGGSKKARRLATCGIALSLFGAAPSAEAEPERVHLRFGAGAGCPSEREFREQVLARAAEIEFEDERPTRELDISAGIDGSGAWGELRFRAPGGEGTSRRIEDKTCDGVVSALALIAVLAVDPQASIDPSLGSPPTARDASPSPARSAPFAIAAAPPRSESTTTLRHPNDRGPVGPPLALGVIASGEARTPESPTLAVGAAIAVELALKSELRPAARLGGRVAMSPRIQRGPGEARFRVVAMSLELSPAHLRFGAIEASAWAGLEYGQLAAEGLGNTGLAQPAQASVPWLALLQTVRLAADVGAGFEAEVELGLVEPLRHDRFYFDQPATLVHAVPDIGAVAGLGAGYHFF
jgi:hypothetical protein